MLLSELKSKTVRKMEQRKINTVIFDLDGTLLDTLKDLSDSVNFALEKYSLPQRNVKEIRRFLGNGIRRLMMESVGPEIAANSNRFEPILQTFREHYVKHCLDTTKPYDGIMDMLAHLKERGYKTAIVSNKLQPAVTELHHRFFGDLVSVAIGESANIRRKPYPDAVLSAVEKLKSSVGSSIYVGDSEVDIETAKAADMSCISVLWGFRDEDFLREKYPVATFVKTPEELERLLLR